MCDLGGLPLNEYLVYAFVHFTHFSSELSLSLSLDELELLCL